MEFPGKQPKAATDLMHSRQNKGVHVKAPEGKLGKGKVDRGLEAREGVRVF